MKFYNKEGRCMNADKGQFDILEGAGWTRTKPEVKEETPDTSDVIDEEVVEPEEEVVSKPAPATPKKVKIKTPKKIK